MKLPKKALAMTVCILTTAIVLMAMRLETPVVAPESELRSHLNPIISLTFSPEGSQMFSGFLPINWLGKLPYREGGAVARWDVSKRERQVVAHLPLWPVAMVLSPDGRQLFVGCGRSNPPGLMQNRSDTPLYRNIGYLKMLDAETLKEITSHKTDCGIYGLEISPDGSKIATIGACGKNQNDESNEVVVQLWKRNGLEEIAKWKFDGRPPHIMTAGALHPLEFSHDGKYLVASTVSSGMSGATLRTTLQGELAIIDLVSLQVHKELVLKTGPIAHIKLSKDDKKLGYDSCISRISLEDALITKPDVLGVRVGGIYFAASARSAIVLRSYDIGRNEANVLKASVFSITHSSDFGYAATPIVRFEGSDQALGINHCFTFSNDGTRLAIGDQNGLIVIWKIPEEFQVE